MVAWKKIAINSSHFTSSFPGGAVVKNLPANAGDKRDIGLIPGSGRSPGEGNGNLLHYSWLENPIDRGAWQGYSPQGHKRLVHNFVTKQQHLVKDRDFIALLL